jgi:hypothetical protein
MDRDCIAQIPVLEILLQKFVLRAIQETRQGPPPGRDHHAIDSAQ